MHKRVEHVPAGPPPSPPPPPFVDTANAAAALPCTCKLVGLVAVEDGRKRMADWRAAPAGRGEPPRRRAWRGEGAAGPRVRADDGFRGGRKRWIWGRRIRRRLAWKRRAGGGSGAASLAREERGRRGQMGCSGGQGGWSGRLAAHREREGLAFSSARCRVATALRHPAASRRRSRSPPAPPICCREELVVLSCLAGS
ncbi:hypothetical protein C2845_PM01G28920 [Panicum miliaceum]|uniref:Uncharacterized protein n=1 Tax=Panicum miliaceum TaxID=4540 RepID=A0A3L6TT39_PANMI|nr:hypothetical protein C2845_PM01G28920 [Panicum miliaceum]